MSSDNQNNECESIENPCPSIELIITPRQRDLGEFSVRRVLPFMKRRMVGPWIFFDHMGPATFDPGPGINVRPHPHINLATVTYLFEGEIFHRDSLGNSQAIRPGDINLMVAGRGIVHSEREREEAKKVKRDLHGLQLWFALPNELEEIDPAFYHYPSSDVPSVDVKGVPVRVMMGEAYGVRSPVKTFSPTVYIEARLKKGESLELPMASERALYFAGGAGEIEGQTIKQYDMAVLSSKNISVKATEDSYIALVGGDPVGERKMFWNFISSRPDRLEQAKKDWKEGKFPKVPGDEEEFIPLPE